MTAPVDPAMNGAPPPVMVPEEREVVAQRLLNAIRVCAENAATDKSAAEAKDWMAAAKSGADAYVVLDPGLDAVGVPLAHQVAMAELDAANKERLENVRAQQAAPAQKRRKVRIGRDTFGRATSYEEE